MRKTVVYKLRKNQKCAHEDCDQTADYVVYNASKHTFKGYCSDHEDHDLDLGAEYNVNCPNCNCRFAV